jgi:hypothetical protein
MWKSGTWRTFCAVCGFEYLADELKQRWDGLYVCDKDFETRHPLDFARVTIKETPLPWNQNIPEDVFLNVCDMFGRSSYAGYAVAGCMIAGLQPILG